MHFFVAGASGRTGTSFVAAALAAGHAVTAFVRDAAKAPPGATVVTGDIVDAAAVAAALRAEHVVVSTLGGKALRAGTANLVAAAVACGARRMLAVVGAGVLQADAQRLRNQLPGYPPFLVAIGQEHMAVLAALRDSPLDWTLACCPDIAAGPASGRCVATVDYLPAGTNRVTTGDIAAFLVGEAERPAFARQRAGLNTPT